MQLIVGCLAAHLWCICLLSLHECTQCACGSCHHTNVGGAQQGHNAGHGPTLQENDASHGCKNFLEEMQTMETADPVGNAQHRHKHQQFFCNKHVHSNRHLHLHGAQVSVHKKNRTPLGSLPGVNQIHALTYLHRCCPEEHLLANHRCQCMQRCYLLVCVWPLRQPYKRLGQHSAGRHNTVRIIGCIAVDAP